VNLSATSCIIYSSSDFTRIHFIYLCDKNFYGTRYQVSYKGRAVWLSELVPLECPSSEYVCHLHTSSVSVSPVSVVTLLEITDQLFITTTTPFSLHFVTLVAAVGSFVRLQLLFVCIRNTDKIMDTSRITRRNITRLLRPMR